MKPPTKPMLRKPGLGPDFLASIRNAYDEYRGLKAADRGELPALLASHVPVLLDEIARLSTVIARIGDDMKDSILITIDAVLDGEETP